jgi:hypothetical protein
MPARVDRTISIKIHNKFACGYCAPMDRENFGGRGWQTENISRIVALFSARREQQQITSNKISPAVRINVRMFVSCDKLGELLQMKRAP